MRKSRNGQVRAFAAITKFWVLLMCFAVVFALVLTTGVLDGTSGNDIGVVQAAEGEGEDARKELATDERFSMSDINAQMREDSSRTSMTFSFRLDEFIPEGNNAALQEYTSVWNWSGYAQGGTFWNEHNGNVGDFGGFAGNTGVGAPTVIASISFPTPSIFLSLVEAGFSVNVNVSARLYVGNSRAIAELRGGFGIVGNSASIEPSTFATDAWSENGGEFDLTAANSAGWVGYFNNNLVGISGGNPNTGVNGQLQTGMEYLTIAAIHESRAGGDAYVFLDETTITFTVSNLPEENVPEDVKFPLQSDGNGPVLNDVTGFTGESTLNGVMDNYVANNFGIEGQVDEMGDMVEDYYAPVINLTESAARRSVNVIDGTNHRYAKSVTLTVYERTMTYNGTPGYEPDATEFVYYAGLGGLSFESPVSSGAPLTAVKYPANSSDQATDDNTVKGKFSYNGGTDNGYYVWTITDNGRIYGTLTLYFNDNDPDLHVYVYDSGGSYLDIKFNIDGIKTGGDDMTGAEGARGNASITDGTRMLDGAQSFDSLTWEWNELYPTFADMGGGADAQVWFYAVQRFDSPDAAAGSGKLYTGDGNEFDKVDENGAPIDDIVVTKGFDAIGYSVDGIFTDNIDEGYIFKTGEVNAGTFGGAKPINDEERTGSGWYRFEFYPMNYAGYLSTEPVVRLVKVDVDTPEVTMEVTYNDTPSLISPGDENGDGIISPQENINGVWVGTPLTVTQTFKPSFSGNKVSVMGADGKTYLVYITATASAATIDGIYLAKTTGGDNGVQGESLVSESGKTTYTFTGGGTFASVEVSVSMAADGKIVVTTVYTGIPGKETEEGFGFTVYTNSQDIKGAKADPGNDVGNSVGGQDPAWEDETGALDAWLNILIDLATPAEGKVTDRGGYIAAVNGGIPTGWDRNWYTDDWKISADLDANSNEYYAVYWAVQRYIDADTFEEDKAAFIEKYIDGGLFMSAEDETFTELLANNSGEYEITPAFGEDAGYYVIFVVVRDRAGNIKTKEFGILVDANEYTVVATLEGEYFDHFKTNPYDLSRSILDENGELAYTFKRGDVIRFQPTFYDPSAHTGAYVPYKVKKIDANGTIINDTPLYKHPDDETGSKFVKDGIYRDEDGNYYEYVKLGTEDGDWLNFKMDRTSVDTLPVGKDDEASGSAQLVFSFRRVTTVALASQSAVYNGGDIPLSVTAYYTDGSLAGDEMNGCEPYVVPTLPKDEAGVVHAGDHFVTIERKHSEFYVMNDANEVKFVVEKAPLTMSVSLTAESYTFGAVAANALQSIVSFGTPVGLVGADADANKAWGDLLGATAVFSYAASKSYVPVGNYSVIVTLTAKDYTVTLEDNTLAFAITARELDFSAAGESITYGDAAPATYTVSVPKIEFDFDIKGEELNGLGLYQDKAGIAAVFGVDESAVSDGGESWNVELPAAAFAKFEVNDFGYLDVNTDGYDITGFNASATEFNNNFEPAYQGGGKVTVSPVTVSVSAVSGISFRANSGEDLSEKEIAFMPNADSIRFGVSGSLRLVYDPEQDPGAAGGTVTYNVSTTEHALSTAHNHDGIVNVLFAVNEGGTVSVVYNAATGTFTIRFNDTVKFEVPYGEFWNTQQIRYDGSDARTYTVTYLSDDGSSTELPANPYFEAFVQGYNGLQGNVLENFVGSYPISFGSFEFDGTTGLDVANFDFVFVDSEGNLVTALNVVKRDVSVTGITFADGALTKEYGDLDGEIPAEATFDNPPAGFGITLGGITRVAGDRGRYDNVGTYGLAWDGSATGSDLSVDIARNFNITGVEDALAAHSFSITAKFIDLALDSGVSIYAPTTKAYDGDAAVIGANISVDNTVIFTVDSGVGITFSAVYWKDGAETGEIGSGLSVMFTVSLTGNDAGNYTLKEATLVWAEGECSILPDPVALNRNMFTVTKVYDGNTKVISVTISGAFEGLEVTVISGDYAGANAAGSVAVPTLIVEIAGYPYPAVINDEITPASYFTLDDFTSVEKQENGTGIRITVLGVTGSIDKREITLDDITFGEDGRTKVYDGSPAFEVPFEFDPDFAALITGFDAKDVDLNFAAEVESKNVNEAGYTLKITEVVLGNETNYVLGEGLNDGGSAAESAINEGGKFFITARPLEFNVAFKDAVYSGAEGPEVLKDEDGVISGLVEGETAVIVDPQYQYARAVVGTDGKTVYELFRYVQTGEGYYDGETYLHDVLASFTITVGGGFEWGNYSFDVTHEEGATEGTYNVTNLFLEKAAVLNPAPVTLTPSLFTIANKEYDATTSATIDFSKAATFVPGDGEYIEFVYTANFENANAGTGKKVTVSSLSLKATDDKYAHIAASYYISSKNTFRDLKADIKPVEVTVEFTIPDKTYDGTRFVNMTNEKGGWELKAPLDDDGNPVRDTWYVAGEPNIGNYGVNILTANFNEADVVMDGDNNPIAQDGSVIGFELDCGTLDVANYVLVVDYTDVTYDLYSLATLANLTEEQVNSIEGVIYEDGERLYLVNEGVTLTGGQLQDTRTYPTAKATGKILPAAVTFTVTITDKTAFTKDFDDTTALTSSPVYGRVGQDGDYDYYITLSSGEAGFIISGDDIHIAFAGAAVGAQDVVFTIDAVTGGNSNYVFNDANNSYTVRGGGYINKFGGTINAELVSEEGGITATYGTADLSYTVRYYYISNTEVVDIIVDAEGNAYVTLDGWKAMFGHDDDDLTADVMTRRYTKANGEWQQSNNGDHIRITGKFGTPTLLTEKGGDKFVDKDGLVCVNAGTYSNVHLDVKADSFNVGIASGSETVTINAKDLRVYVTNAGEGGNFTADYFVGKLPVPGFGLYMEGDVDDLAAFDSWTTVRTTLRGQFMMNGETPLTSTDVPTGNYALKVTTTTGNYNVIIVTEAGETATHKLVITIPKLDTTQYKVKTNLKRQYELGADGGVALGASDLLNATAVADGSNIIDITWKDANGNEIPEPTDVGTYNWELTVTKKIGGSQTYTYAGEFTANGSFTIEKRRITVSLKESVGFTYDDGKAHVITKDDLTAKDADGNADEFIALISNNITYLLNGTSCTDMTNAGGYTVVLEFEDSPNYELVNNVGTVYVKAKPITVKVDPASKVYDATNGINGNVGISFTAEGADASNFSVVYRSAGNVVGAITTPGIYTYTIVSKDPNYTVSGESTGNFNVQISKVTYTKDDIDYVTIAFGSPVAVNYYLNDTAVAQGSGYWNIVDANVQKLAGEDGGLVTNGIIRIEMSNNNGVVSTVPGGVTVTARIPAGVGSDFTLYRVTSSGGLEVVEDYTVANGVVTYTTDYISNLVFVGTAPAAGFPWWIIPIIAAALVLTLALAILIAVLVKLHRAPDPIPVEVTPIDSIMPEPPVPAPAAPVAPVIVEVPAADIAPTVYDAPAAVSKHKQPPIIGIR